MLDCTKITTKDLDLNLILGYSKAIQIYRHLMKTYSYKEKDTR